MNSEVSSPPARPPEAARRALIAERRNNSLFWRVVHVFGSLKLALFLLAIIAVACAVATFYEAGFNAKVAQAHIYKAPWFLFWIGLLCVNLIAVTLTRWPWQKKHTGFIITHYGIVLLLIGAMIGSRMGFEGNVTLHKDSPPLNRITTSRSVIQIEGPVDTALYIRQFDAAVTRPSERRPRRFPVPGTAWTIVATDFSEDLTRDHSLQPSQSPADPPGVELTFTGAMAGEEGRRFQLAADGEAGEADFFGMARIRLLRELPERESAQVSETQMVFAGYAPVVEGRKADAGPEFRLSPDGKQLTVRTPEGVSATYNRAEIEGASVTAGEYAFVLREYWPDFEMRDGRPASASEEPNNPAALVQVFSGGGEAGLLLELAPSGPDRVAFQLSRGGTISANGEVAAGESFGTGWGDWVARLDAFHPKARLHSETRPVDADKGEEATGIPGFLAFLDTGDGVAGEPVWVESGAVTTLRAGDRFVRMGYGLELRPVPFSIRLLDFEVPRFEGTQTPSNYIATVEFRDPTTGERKTGQARMNHPASWPGGVWAHVTGINYKFSQAEWNPQDLGETTLQVLYDPGWLLKWIGSLAICIGITILFYWKPRSGTARVKS